MLYACVEKFDVTGTVGKILGTKRGLRLCLARPRQAAKGMIWTKIFWVWWAAA